MAFAWLALALVLNGCDSDPTAPDLPHFGQIGQIQVEVLNTLGPADGTLIETLSWRSTGPWVLAERVSLRGIVGGETIRRSRLNPGELATEYLALITELNEGEEVRLLGGGVPEGGVTTCAAPRSRVTVTIRDDVQNEVIRWVRCATGTLFDLVPLATGTPTGDAQLVAAVGLVRSNTLGDDASSTYSGTTPYGTIQVGEHSPALPDGSRAFMSSTGRPPDAFVEFWELHAGEGSALPAVDWGRDIVLLIAVGERDEAGGTLEVKRVLPGTTATRVEAIHRERGDFCTPAKANVHPFHIVVVPAVPIPIHFDPPEVDRIPCGLF